MIRELQRLLAEQERLQVSRDTRVLSQAMLWIVEAKLRRVRCEIDVHLRASLDRHAAVPERLVNELMEREARGSVREHYTMSPHLEKSVSNCLESTVAPSFLPPYRPI